MIICAAPITTPAFVSTVSAGAAFSVHDRSSDRECSFGNFSCFSTGDESTGFTPLSQRLSSMMTLSSPSWTYSQEQVSRTRNQRWLRSRRSCCRPIHCHRIYRLRCCCPPRIGGQLRVRMIGWTSTVNWMIIRKPVRDADFDGVTDDVDQPYPWWLLLQSGQRDTPSHLMPWQV
jgi:hypothetical protein